MEEKLRIIRDILGAYRQSSNEFLFQCPFCGHHKKKMSVNFGINAFKCWVCDTRGKNIYRLVRKFGTYQQKQNEEQMQHGSRSESNKKANSKSKSSGRSRMRKQNQSKSKSCVGSTLV